MKHTNTPFNENSLFEQMSNITKAHAYDIVVKQVGELKEIIRQLIEIGELEDLTFTDNDLTEEFQGIVRKAKILSL